MTPFLGSGSWRVGPWVSSGRVGGHAGCRCVCPVRQEGCPAPPQQTQQMLPTMCEKHVQPWALVWYRCAPAREDQSPSSNFALTLVGPSGPNIAS